MYKLQLTKGRSYTGRGVKATAEKPFVEVKDKETSEALVASGRFILAGEVKDDGGAGGGNDKPVDKMTEKELEAYAAENGIDLAGLTKKADKLAKILEVLAAADGGDGEGGDDLFNEDN